MSDIYISELNKWLNADSPDDAKAFFNLETLRTVRSFAFYTTSKNTARWAVGEKRMLKDFRLQKIRFRFHSQNRRRVERFYLDHRIA